MDNLVYMAGTPAARVSSRALKQELDWNDNRFHRARTRLIDSGVIRGVHGGPGGSLELLKGVEQLSGPSESENSGKPIQAFVSYSHADSKLKSELIKHLSPLNRLQLVSHWDDGEIKPGDTWEKVIAEKMASAKLILLLISADFIASEFCYQNELKEALARDASKTARVLPVIVRPCLWQDLPFGKLQATPPDGKPITSWPTPDDAMVEVAKAVRIAAQTLRGFPV